MYENDSFFDLSTWGQIGLACLSLLLFVLFLITAWRLFRDRPVWLRLLGALTLFWVFVWVSPQIYYQYYRILIPTLPVQWVIWPPRSPYEALTLLFFQGPQNLSAHGQAILGWSLVAIALVRNRMTPRRSDP